MAYYSLGISVSNVGSVAFYSVSLTAGQTVDGAAQFLPNMTQYTYASFQGNAVQIQCAPGSWSAGATVDATTSVAGNVIVSPAVNVPVTITLYGRGQLLGTYSVPAGQSSGHFNFNTSSAEAFGDSAEALGAAIKLEKQ